MHIGPPRSSFRFENAEVPEVALGRGLKVHETHAGCLLQSISVHSAFGGIMSEKPSAILPGTVEKIIKSPFPSEPEKAQITVEGGDHLYREIRIDNTLTNEQGEEVSLKPGAHVEVTVAAEADATMPKSGAKTHTLSWTASRP
jgi:hypothetical protein